MLSLLLSIERAAVAWTRRLALLGGWILLPLAAVTVADALLRKFFLRPIPGTFEITELFLAVIIFFGIPYTGLTDSHISVDLLTGRLSARLQFFVIALNGLVCGVVLGFIAYQMGLLAAEYAKIGRTTITTRLPVVPFLVPVTGAAALAALGFVVQALGAVARAVRPDLAPSRTPR